AMSMAATLWSRGARSRATARLVVTPARLSYFLMGNLVGAVAADSPGMVAKTATAGAAVEVHEDQVVMPARRWVSLLAAAAAEQSAAVLWVGSTPGVPAALTVVARAAISRSS